MMNNSNPLGGATPSEPLEFGRRHWLAHAQRVAILCLCALTGVWCGLSGCSPAPVHYGRDLLRQEQRALAALRMRTDPASLAAAAVLLPSKQAAEALSLIHRAAAASDRPEWTWLEVSMCSQTPTCDPLPVEQRLQQLDPENGAGWLGTFHRAFIQHDEVGVDAALAAIGKTSHVNMSNAPLTVHITHAMADSGDLDLSTALILRMSAPMGGPHHVFADSIYACQVEALKRPSRLDACRAAAASLRNGDTELSELAGLAIAIRAWPKDSPEYRSAAEEERLRRYRTHMLLQSDSLFLPMPPSPQQAREYVELLSHYPRAIEMMGAQLAARHIDPMPPADWPTGRL
jgi:hypothetical protein